MTNRVTSVALQVLLRNPPGTAIVTTVAVTVLRSIAESSTTTVSPSPGVLEVEGSTPTVIQPVIADPIAGVIEILGATPLVVENVDLTVLPGSIEILGATPVVDTVGILIHPLPGVVEVSGGQPLISTEFSANVSSQAMLVLGGPPPPSVRVSEHSALVVGAPVPDVRLSGHAIMVLAHGGPCVTARCQIWTITRTDGEVFRYTSHDVDVRYGGEVYESCNSLNPSASENAATLGSVGNIELVGIIDDDGISEEDLYGGKFDDAYVTVDLISWGDPVDVPRRLASGWTGQLSQGDTSFNMEVLGSSSRLEQQALTQPFAPGCRWDFGDDRCGVNVEGMALDGAVVAVASRSRFSVVLSGGDGGRQWANGRLRWTSGPNAGQVLEVKEVDFGAQVVTLWPSAPLLPEVGDEFDLLPGCDKAKTGGCTVYANIINFGGFPDVPGQDALLETPNAQY